MVVVRNLRENWKGKLGSVVEVFDMANALRLRNVLNIELNQDAIDGFELKCRVFAIDYIYKCMCFKNRKKQKSNCNFGIKFYNCAILALQE